MPQLTVQQHILQEQSRVEGASGQFSWLLSGITLATKMIQEKVRREANPIAFLAEQAGGTALAGAQRILDVDPEDVHQRTPVIVGSEHEMKAFRTCWQEHATDTSGS